MKKKKDPKLKNIIILGMFDDDKVRQLFCNDLQQAMVCNALLRFSPGDKIEVYDKEMEGISWESDVNLSEMLK